MVAAQRVSAISGDGPAARWIAQLVADYAWSSRTNSSRGSKWKYWLQFWEKDNRVPLSVTEGHLVAFFGYLKHQREIAGRKVSSVSIPQYLSAVLQMHSLYTGSAIPSYKLIDIFMRSYLRWE